MTPRPDNNNRRDSRYNRGESGRPQGPRHQPKSMTSVASGQLPKWVKEEIQRSTPKDRREPALKELSSAVDNYADDRFAAALPHLRKAKTLAPRSSTIRELLGLSAYRTNNWDEALRELRTFRRLTGDLIHMPIEMDCLRAMGKKADVTKTWERIREHDISATIDHESRVVYASFLLDEGRPRDAWAVIKPGRLVASPAPGELRRWFVAARVALAAGDKDAAGRLVAALDEQDLDFEGMDQLRKELL